LTTASPGQDRAATGSPRPATRASWQPLAGVGLIAGLIVVLDQISKALIVAAFGPDAPVHGQALIPGIFDLHYLENRGAAFGLFQNGGWLLALIAAAVIIIIVVLVPRLHARPEGVPWFLLPALGLVLGGALGNLTDRVFRSPGVFRGAVVDFISPAHFAVFNLADSAIVCGGILIVLLSFRGLDPDGTVHKD